MKYDGMEMRTHHHWAWIGAGANAGGTHYPATPRDRIWARGYPLWMWWNLLSLDAPTVVCLWALFFAHALGMPFPLLASVVLTATVWLIYASDRVLDGLRASSTTQSSDRHNFYVRHRYAVLAALLPVASATAWIAFTKLGGQARLAGLIVCAAVFFYFLAIHAVPEFVVRWFPKELVAGAVFAAGAAIPAWTHVTQRRMALILPVLLFGALCGLNCAAIECWEHHRGGRDWKHRPYWLIRSVDARIVPVSASLIVCAAVLAIFGPHITGQLEVLGATAASLFFLAVLDRQSDRLSPQALRVLADAALLTPILFLIKPVF